MESIIHQSSRVPPKQEGVSNADEGNTWNYKRDVHEENSSDPEYEDGVSESDRILSQRHSIVASAPDSTQPRNTSYALSPRRSSTSSFRARLSFATARTSLASYFTARTRHSFAPALSSSASYDIASESSRKTTYTSHGIPDTERAYFNRAHGENLWLESLALGDAIAKRLLHRTGLQGLPQDDIKTIKTGIRDTHALYLCPSYDSSRIVSLELAIQNIADHIKTFEPKHKDGSDVDIRDLILDVGVEIYLYALGKHALKRLIPSGMITDGRMTNSEWLMHLHSRGILPDEEHALDWSGRGQHAEYSPNEETSIPLVEGKVLGHSMSAVVQSVRCRRIELARKTIRCTRRFTKEMVVTEVQHLQELQHRHIVRLVGTYTFKKNLAILLYPAARWNLDEFLDKYIHNPPDTQRKLSPWRFFGCLANAMAFIYKSNVKHMDIKPGNILVRENGGAICVYIADFGIARAYRSAEESNTDTPTPFTRTYAAPEVKSQDRRGYSADIFSLGCVFLEILEALLSVMSLQPTPSLSALRTGDRSYSANLEAICGWCDQMYSSLRNPGLPKVFMFPVLHREDWIPLLKKSLDIDPGKRPSAFDWKYELSGFWCMKCNDGPEPFEAAV
jgi:serine/threonine protein kinase